VRSPRELIDDGWSAFTGPDGWRTVLWPAVFALAALVLLVYDHLHERINQLIFWLCVALIGSVFAWMVETTRRKAAQLAAEHRRASLDEVTGLPNRGELLSTLGAIYAAGERRTLILCELDGLRVYYDSAGEVAGDALVTQVVARLTETVAPVGGSVFRVDMTRFAALVPPDGSTSGEILLSSSMAVNGEEGADVLVGRSYGEVVIPDQAERPELALQIAGQRVAAYKQRQQRSARRQAHAVLMAVLDARRPDLRSHLRSVAFRSISVSRRLGLHREEIDDIFLAAELQDIGLLAVPEQTLEKEDPLTPSESLLIRNHPVEGAQIVGAAPGLSSVATIIRSVAERFDGGGYPDGLTGARIPIGSRVIAVCVSYAAMTARRPYSAPLSGTEAMAELRRCAGTQFDPVVVDALAADLAEESERAVVPTLA